MPDFTKGRNQYVGIKKEATRLTAETSGFVYFPPLTDFSVVAQMEQFKDESGYGAVGKLLNQVPSKRWAEGSMGGAGDTDWMLWALWHTFGAGTPTTALGATSWALTVKTDNLLPSFTIQTERVGDGYRKIEGCSIKTFNFSISPDESTYSVDIAAIKESAGNSQTSAYTKPSKTLLGRNASLGFATTKAGLSSATNVSKVQSAEFEFNTGVEAQFFIGSEFPGDVPANGREASLKATVTLDSSNSLNTQFEAGTKLAFKLDVLGSNYPVIGTSALKPRFTIEVPPSLIKVINKVERDDYNMYDLEIDIEQPELITILLINAISTTEYAIA